MADRAANPKPRGLSGLLLLVIVGQLVGLSLPGWFQLNLGEPAVLLIAALWGPQWGLLASAVAGMCCVIADGHAYVLPVMGLEGLVVGWLIHYTGLPVMVLSSLYWLVIGAPLFALLAAGPLGLDGEVLLIMGTRWVLGGLIHGLMAGLILAHLPMVRWLHPPLEAPGLTLRRSFSQVLVALALAPAILFASLDAVRSVSRERDGARSRLDVISHSGADAVRNWFADAVNSLQGIPGAAGDLGAPERNRLERALGVAREGFPDFHLLALTDSRGNVLASRSGCAMGTTPAVLPPPGRVPWPPRPGRAGPSPDGCPDAVVPVTLPLRGEGGRVEGYLVAALQLDSLPSRVRAWRTDSGPLEVELSDGEGRLLAGVGKSTGLLEPLPEEVPGDTQWLDRQTSHWMPRRGAPLKRWRDSRLRRRELLGGELPWTLETAIPMREAFEELSEDLLGHAARLLLLVLMVLAVADPLSRWMLVPLKNLAILTKFLSNPPEGRPTRAPPKTGVEELDELRGNVLAIARNLERSGAALEEALGSLAEIENARVEASEQAGEDLQSARHSRAQAEARSRLYEEIFLNSTDGIAVLDAEGRYLSQNLAHRTLLGYPDEQLENRTPAVHLGQDAFDRIAAALQREGRMTGIFPSRARDGREIVIDLSAFTVPDEDGEPLYYVGIKRDATERFRHQRNMEEARDAAEAAYVARGELCTHLSRELRTPLHGILGMVEVMLEGDPPEETREYLEHILSSSQQLRHLVEELMVFTSLDAGRIRLEEAPFVPKEVFEQVIEDHREAATLNEIELGLVLGPDLDRPLVGDASRLRQVLSYLVAGSMSSSRTESVRIRAQGIREMEGSFRLELAVDIRGMTSPEPGGRRLYHGFKHGDFGAARELGAVGLGLPIAAGLIERMDGRLTVETGRQEGTSMRFELTLPAAGSGELPLARSKEESAPPASPEEPQRVLIAEDNEVNCILVEALLARRGWSSVAVATGVDAVAAVAAEDFDLVLMDLHMPEMDGFEATRKIRVAEEEAGSQRLPIVALTADALPGTRERCFEVGMDAYLAKPIDLAQFDEMMGRLLGQKAEDASEKDAS